MSVASSCAKCGQGHPRCAGHRSKIVPAVPCMGWPEKGATVCRVHGGNAPQVKARAEVVRKEEAAGKALTRWAKYADVSADINPVDALLDEYRRTRAVVAYLDSVVGSAGFEDVWEDKAGRLQLEVRVEWWQQERDRLTKLVESMHKIGISERQTQVMEAQAVQLVAVIRGVLDALGLTAEQRALVPGIVRAQLAAIRPESES